jgi:hypothetical protein
LVLIVEKSSLIETPCGAVVQVEKAVGARFLPWKVIAVLLWDQPGQLSIGQFLKLIRSDRVSHSQPPFFHAVFLVDESTWLLLGYMNKTFDRKLYVSDFGTAGSNPCSATTISKDSILKEAAP